MNETEQNRLQTVSAQQYFVHLLMLSWTVASTGNTALRWIKKFNRNVYILQSDITSKGHTKISCVRAPLHSLGKA